MPLRTLLVIALVLLTACSTGPAVDLSLKLAPGTVLHYQVTEKIEAKSTASDYAMPPMGSPLDVTLSVASVAGGTATGDCTIGFSARAMSIPVSVNTRTGAASVLPLADGSTLTDGQVATLFHDRCMFVLGVRPDKASVRLGARWKGELRQLPIGTYFEDPARIPVEFRLTAVENNRATITFAGSLKVEEATTSKSGPATGSVTADGTGTYTVVVTPAK